MLICDWRFPGPLIRTNLKYIYVSFSYAVLSSLIVLSHTHCTFSRIHILFVQFLYNYNFASHKEYGRMPLSCIGIRFFCWKIFVHITSFCAAATMEQLIRHTRRSRYMFTIIQMVSDVCNSSAPHSSAAIGATSATSLGAWRARRRRQSKGAATSTEQHN